MRTPHRRLSVASLPSGKCVREASGVERRKTEASSAWVFARSVVAAAGAMAAFVAATLYGCGLPLGGLKGDGNSTFTDGGDPPGDPPDGVDPPDGPSGDDGEADDGDVTIPPDPVHEGGHEDHVDARPPVTDGPTESDVDGGTPEAGPDARPDAPPDAPPDSAPPPPPPPMPPTFIQVDGFGRASPGDDVHRDVSEGADGGEHEHRRHRLGRHDGEPRLGHGQRGQRLRGRRGPHDREEPGARLHPVDVLRAEYRRLPGRQHGHGDVRRVRVRPRSPRGGVSRPRPERPRRRDRGRRAAPAWRPRRDR